MASIIMRDVSSRDPLAQKREAAKAYLRSRGLGSSVSRPAPGSVVTIPAALLDDLSSAVAHLDDLVAVACASGGLSAADATLCRSLVNRCHAGIDDALSWGA